MRPVDLSLAFVMGLLFGGCVAATPLWTRPGTTIEQMRVDRESCLAQARRYLLTGEPWTDYDALDRCMKFKGYVSTKT